MTDGSSMSRSWQFCLIEKRISLFLFQDFELQEQVCEDPKRTFVGRRRSPWSEFRQQLLWSCELILSIYKVKIAGTQYLVT